MSLHRSCWVAAVVAALVGGLLPTIVYAQQNELRGAFGQHGTSAAINMPTGRMAPDGEFGIGYSEVSPYRRYFFAQQFLPWLQGTYRYTAIAYRRYGDGGFAQNQSYKDKSVDVKLRLFQEGPYLPEISVGIRDIGGTGLFAGEYVAATRRIYDFDITGGLGWGNIGARGGLTNPFGYISDRFKNGNRFSGSTGTLNSVFFSGEEVSPYGAVEWYPTEMPNLSFKLEYDGNDYKSEPFGKDLKAVSAFNFGLVYRPFKWVDVAASYERGNTVGLRVILHTNFNTDRGVPKVSETPPFPVPPETLTDGQLTASGASRPVRLPELAASLSRAGLQLASVDFQSGKATLRTRSVPSDRTLASVADEIWALPEMGQYESIAFVGPNGEELRTITAMHASSPGAAPSQKDVTQTQGGLAGTTTVVDVENLALARRVSKALTAIGFDEQAFSLDQKRAYLQYSQKLYTDRDKALIRAARVLAAVVPASVEVLDLSEQEEGVVVKRIAFLRRDIARAANYQGSFDEAWVNASSLDLKQSSGDWIQNSDDYPGFSWGLSPKLRQSVGGPDNFYLYQVYGALSGEVRLNKNLSVTGGVGANITNNFENFSYEAPSKLQRVRTKIKDYLKDSPQWIDHLNINYINKLSDNVYYRLSGGIFEWMYSGVGGEILYRKPDARWALGLDADYVWQRDFDGGFGLLGYNTAVGNLTYYQQLPFWDLDTQLSVGRYLAGDIGATFTLSRKFKNGVRVGVWATKTNVSAEQFGEGSFDKGFRVTIPFEVFSTKPSTSMADFMFAPLTRDGGQKVVSPKPLYSTLFTGGGD